MAKTRSLTCILRIATRAYWRDVAQMSRYPAVSVSRIIRHSFTKLPYADGLDASRISFHSLDWTHSLDLQWKNGTAALFASLQADVIIGSDLVSTAKSRLINMLITARYMTPVLSRLCLQLLK